MSRFLSIFLIFFLATAFFASAQTPFTTVSDEQAGKWNLKSWELVADTANEDLGHFVGKVYRGATYELGGIKKTERRSQSGYGWTVVDDTLKYKANGLLSRIDRWETLMGSNGPVDIPVQGIIIPKYAGGEFPEIFEYYSVKNGKQKKVHTTRVYFDGEGHKLRSSQVALNADGEATEIAYVETFEYDTQGRLVRKESYTDGIAGEDSPTRRNVYSFDENGFLRGMVETVDGRGAQIKSSEAYVVDDAGRPEIVFFLNAKEEKIRSSHLKYDSNGRVVEETLLDAEGNLLIRFRARYQTW